MAKARPGPIVTAPVICGMILPFALLDRGVPIRQTVCFPACGIPKVRRSDHIGIDRHDLQQRNGLQKRNCVCCGGCNGLISWIREIASRTEAYWCPIAHAGPVRHPPARYATFLDFGDGEGFEEGLARARRDVSRDA